MRRLRAQTPPSLIHISQVSSDCPESETGKSTCSRAKTLSWHQNQRYTTRSQDQQSQTKC